MGMVEELDLLLLGQTLLCLAHGLFLRDPFGLTLLPSALFLGLTLEQASIRLGGTHCHASSPLSNFSECSSLNSVLLYVVWIYLCVLTTRRLSPQPHHWTSPFLAGLVFFGYCGVYELQGPLMGWWWWPADDLVLKAGGQLQQFGALADDPRGVVTSPYVATALSDRVFGVPLMALYFHVAIGGAIYACLQVMSFLSPFLAVLLAPPIAMLWDIPIHLLIRILPGTSRALVAPILMLGSLLSPFLFGPPLKLDSPSDIMLLIIPLIHHGYFISSALLRHGKETLPNELKLTLCFLAGISLALHACASGMLMIFRSERRKLE